jgi:MOSC domain-containing protein YiiM
VNGIIVQISVSRGGVPKTAITEARVTLLGLEGDAHRLLLGETVLVQVTRYTSPCMKIARAFKDGDFTRVSPKNHPGWSRVYARVLATGTIRQGDPARLLDEIEAAEVVAATSR